MIAEAIKAISDMARTAALAAAPQVVKEIDDPRELVLLTADGHRVEIPKPHKPHREDFETPAELAAFVNAELLTGEGTPAVFVDVKEVVAVHDLRDRIDRSTCRLELTEPFKLLEALAKGPVWHTQKDFVRRLRVELRGCLPSDGLLAWVRAVKFENGVVGSGVIAQGSNAMSRSVRAEVTGQGNAPEEVTVVVPVFKQSGQRAQVVCAVEIDPDSARFALTPYAGETDEAIDEALRGIQEALAETIEPDKCRVYLGRP